MLQPRKDPLIDGPVTVGTARRLRRWQVGCVGLAVVVAGLIASWPSSHAVANEVADEVWWRRLISSIVLKRLAHDVDTSAVVELKQRIAQLEAERISLSERIAEADKLIQIDRSGQRLVQVVAHREGKDISFEVLVRNPGESTNNRLLSVEVVAIRNPAPSASVARASTLAFEVDRTTRLAVRSPRVAETFQGRLTSSASHLLVMVTPADGVAETEAVLVPVTGKA
ncbi:MAG: hypothetical protein FGM40_05780 [Rhodocyclaceae bacterium]|nr:hypothetical protein [Rhodocyclaceae bacterium]